MSTKYSPLTVEEKKAIKKLRQLAQMWPKSLWLFNNGTMYVMKKGPDGRQFTSSHGGVDPDYTVTSIGDMPSDGGDW